MTWNDRFFERREQVFGLCPGEIRGMWAHNLILPGLAKIFLRDLVGAFEFNSQTLLSGKKLRPKFNKTLDLRHVT